MSDDKTYNGWSNHSTLCVNLWLSNEQWSDSWCCDAAREAVDDAKGNRDDAIHKMATRLQELVETPIDEGGMMPKIEGIIADLLGSAMAEVNWREIAEYMIEEPLTAYNKSETVGNA